MSSTAPTLMVSPQMEGSPSLKSMCMWHGPGLLLSSFLFPLWLQDQALLIAKEELGF